MSIKKEHLEGLVIKTLKEYPELYSDAAVNLVLGTIAQESQYGTYLKQLNNGPALSIAQIEKVTFDWLKETFGIVYNFENRTFNELEWDLKLSILICRLRYYANSAPLPETNNIKEIARYWKKIYNTSYGSGKVDDFKDNYIRYVYSLAK